MSGMTPTQRTLDECRRRGWLADKTEQWQSSFAHTGVVKAARQYVTAPVHYRSEKRLIAALHSLDKTGPGKHKDLFGFIDVLAIADKRFLGIQCTAGSGVSARVNKILLQCREPATAWLRAGGLIQVWGWRKYKTPVERRYWRPFVQHVTLETLGL